MRILSLLLGAAIAWGQQPPTPPTPPPPAPAADPVVLTIGDQKITKSEFEQILSGIPDQQRAMAQTPEGKKKVAVQLVEIMTLAKAARDRKLDQTPKVRLQLTLSADQLLANTMYRDLGESSKPDEASLRAYYDQHKQDWEEVKARHILIRFQGSTLPLKPNQKDLTDAEALAKVKDLKAKLAAGSDFAELAKAESDDAGTGVNGGDLGAFGKGRMVPAFEAVAFALAVGQVSEPVKTQFGYHLIQVEAHSSKPFEAVRREIETKIKPDMARKALEDLKAKTPPVFDEGYFGK